jgi:hypothetical protein
MKSREAVRVGHAPQMVGIRDKFRILCGKPELSVSEVQNRWEDNIKMDYT